MTTIDELRDMGTENLRQRAAELDDAIFRLRIQKSMGQTDAANRMRRLRRDRARVRTLLREQELEQAGPDAAA